MLVRNLLVASRHTGIKIQRATLSRNVPAIISRALQNDIHYKFMNPARALNAQTYIHYSSNPNEDGKKVTPTAQDSNKLTRAQKLKKAVAEYGTTVIVFHVGISLISLGSCYFLVSSGLDVNQMLIRIGLSEWIKENNMLVSNAGTFAVAYAVHKVFAPVRISITLASVPFIVRYLRQKGILKK